MKHLRRNQATGAAPVDQKKKPAILPAADRVIKKEKRNFLRAKTEKEG